VSGIISESANRMIEIVMKIILALFVNFSSSPNNTAATMAGSRLEIVIRTNVIDWGSLEPAGMTRNGTPKALLATTKIILFITAATIPAIIPIPIRRVQENDGAI